MATFTLHAAHARLARQQAAQLVRILRDADTTLDQVKPSGTPAGDPERLRGLPAVGRGVGGAIKGSRPHVDGIR